jgi:hypothetical protein
MKRGTEKDREGRERERERKRYKMRARWQGKDLLRRKNNLEVGGSDLIYVIK